MKGTITLSPCLDSQSVEALAAVLAAHRGHGLVLDAGQVNFVGALAAQLLVAARRQWIEEGKLFSIESTKGEFIEALDILGIPPETLGLAPNGEVGQ